MRPWISIVAIAALATVAGQCVGAEQITPDATIQAQIAAAAAAKTDSELQTALAELKQSGGADYEKLVPQLVYVLMHSKDDRSAMISGVIVDRLDISPSQLRRALEPYRMTKDPQLKRQIENLLGEETADHTPTP